VPRRLPLALALAAACTAPTLARAAPDRALFAGVLPADAPSATAIAGRGSRRSRRGR
jgi:hypothetical protein